MLVERGVHHTEFSEFEVFDPDVHGEGGRSHCSCSVACAEGSSAAVDLGITLGGDGTVLHLASLFVEDVPLPPVVSFAMGESWQSVQIPNRSL